jgi:16S rRNA (cytosine967-C5)-methyltransferase
MASIVKPSVSGPNDAWVQAVWLLGRWQSEGERVDRLLEGLPAAMAGVERARCQHLVFGVLRNLSLLEAEVNRLIAHPPRLVTRTALLTAGFELLEAAQEGAADPGLVPKIVHHAVDRVRGLASPPESRLANAVLRRLDAALRARPAPPRLSSAEVLSEHFSHPVWLVRRWLAHFGAEGTRALLEWNQRPAPVLARLRPGTVADGVLLRETRWPGYAEVTGGRWGEIDSLLKAHRIYPQDPSARLAVGLLAPRPGERMLDACASPGGKSLLIADTLCGMEGAPAKLVAMDLPGERIGRLRSNLASAKGAEVAIVEADLLRGPARQLESLGLPAAFDAVLVDAPCSNTGVMRHRVDVRWRLQEGDFGRHARQQLAMLRAAARLVAPGGRLVYSTCSLDPEENEKVVSAFAEAAGTAFKLERTEIALPWVAGHDGGCAALFRRA